MNKVICGQGVDLHTVRSYYIQDTTGLVTSLVVLKYEDTVNGADFDS